MNLLFVVQKGNLYNFNEIYPRALWELADVVAKPLLIIFEVTAVSEVPSNLRKENITLNNNNNKEDPGSYRTVSL